MAALFHSLIACCFGEKDKDTPSPQETTPFLPGDPSRVDDEVHDDDSTRTGYYDEQRAQELNQKVAEIVTNGSGRMLNPILLHGRPVYSPILPTASSSQANLPDPSTSRRPQPLGSTYQQQPPLRESRHSSQSSRHSSYKAHHPSLLPHVETRPTEDGVSALDGLTANQSLTSGGGNTSQINYGTMGMGASATGRRFQIHRGRPPSRTKPAQNGVGTAVQSTQTNGVASAGEAGDEPKQRSETPSSQPPASPPRAINNSKSEEGSAERSPDFNEKRQVHFKLPPGDLILQYDD